MEKTFIGLPFLPGDEGYNGNETWNNNNTNTTGVDVTVHATTPKKEPPKEDNTIWWIVGLGVAAFLLIKK